MNNNHFCQNCILPNGFLGIKLDQEGLCNFCTDPFYKNSNWSKKNPKEDIRIKASQNWRETIKKITESKNNIKYNCILGYSGGKDSTALLDMLINDFKLKPLAVTINNGHLTDIARENIQKTLKTLNYSSHHICIENAVPTFNKLFKYIFLNHNSNEKIITGKVCDYCCDLMHSILVKQAINKKISIIFLGYSPDQIKRYFYEIPKEYIKQKWFPDFILKQPFDENDRKFFLNPREIKNEKIPRILLPYHIIDYDEKEIIDRLNSKNLIEKGKADPVLTNCHVGKAAILYDFYRFGGLSYALQYAELVRQEPTEEKRKKSRKKWLRLYRNVAKAIIHGKFDKKGIEDLFNQINISKKKLLENIKYRVDRDPNKELILENINFFK
jgi:tRNA(Ile)-lysidine synthase TilS/MesJ